MHAVHQVFETVLVAPVIGNPASTASIWVHLDGFSDVYSDVLLLIADYKLILNMPECDKHRLISITLLHKSFTVGI